MRDVLRDVVTPGQFKLPDQSHLGLVYGAWAPVGDDGKVPDTERQLWLETLANLKISGDYECAFNRWNGGFAGPGYILMGFTLASRLLIGHGLPSATEVGLTLHHTWGVPVIPGSALKGLCAHYTVLSFGPDAGKDNIKLPSWQQSDKERAGFQGVLWRERKIAAGPGPIFRALFGAPDAQLDKETPENWGAGAEKGRVVFHDAWYVPGSAMVRDNGQSSERPFAPDVLTVHNKTYYDAQEKAKAGQPAPWPNDYDSPNPVAFLTVRPGAKFRIALEGPQAETELAAEILKAALAEWGAGGKTSLGYGRGEAQIIKEWGVAVS